MRLLQLVFSIFLVLVFAFSVINAAITPSSEKDIAITIAALCLALSLVLLGIVIKEIKKIKNER